MSRPDEYTDPFARGDDDAALSRREFLERTAYTAGVAGMAAALPASTLMTQAAQAYSQNRPLPHRRNLPIDHFVYVMMENRSFDHYFGWASQFADAVKHQSFRDLRDGRSGKSVKTFHASKLGDARYTGCGFNDPGHSWKQARAQFKHGFLARKSGNDKYALAYYDKGELEFLHDAAMKYTLFDHYHASLLGPTFPNRYYKWAAQSGGRKDNSLPVESQGVQFETLFDRAQKFNPTDTPGGGGPTYRYYASDQPFSAVYGARAAPWTRRVEDYLAALEQPPGSPNGLENIVIVDPPFTDGGGGDGLSADEHPHGDVRRGQAFLSTVINAFVNSPYYRRGALFLIYDEWGGFFDHVRPPHAADDRASRDLYKDFGRMGYRIPAVAISPYTRRQSREVPRVNHGLFGHESILKLVTYKFGLGHLVLRDAKANNIGEAFNFDKKDFDPPDLPKVLPPGNPPCTVQDAEHREEFERLGQLAQDFGFPGF